MHRLVKEMDASKERHAHLKEAGRMDLYEKAVAEDCPVLKKDYDAIFECNINDRLDGKFFKMLAEMRALERGQVTKHQAAENVSRFLTSTRRQDPVNNAAPRYTYEQFLNENA
jgi:hypothetical protein